MSDCNVFWTVRKQKAEFVEEDPQSLLWSAGKPQADLPPSSVRGHQIDLHDLLHVFDELAWCAAEPRYAHPLFQASVHGQREKTNRAVRSDSTSDHDSYFSPPLRRTLRFKCTDDLSDAFRVRYTPSDDAFQDTGCHYTLFRQKATFISNALRAKYP